ncbi:MAG: hypothetical protein NTV82_17655 [Candidatus Aminicenantes bacterium]|jgi:hypothetical protein|nr:hypothetical protein [Candidatus Aminicenantes bacterium]
MSRFRIKNTIFFLSGFLMALPAFTQVVGPEKKIISGGADNRTADYVRQNIESMERVPFDGICINVYTKKNGKVEPYNLRVMDPNPLAFEDFADSIADLKATKFKRFKDNFLWVWIAAAPGAVSMDFFDDYAVVINNWRTAARIAKEGGYRGFFVDTEQYDTQWGPFAWTRVKYSDTKTQADYAAQAKKRGAEVMRAINEVYPDIHMLWFFGYSANGPGRSHFGAYAFVPDFIDGMLSEAKPEARIIDGYEQSYGYKTKAFFVEARDLMKNKMKATSSVKDKFEKNHEAGFGLWLDGHGSVLGWNPADFLKNYFTPEEFEYSLCQALNYTDQYVWVWFERGSFWTGSNVPWPYFRALTEARKPHTEPPASIPKNPPPGAPPPLRIGGYGGEDTALLLGTKYRRLGELGRRWRWRPDFRDRGFEEKWQAFEFDDSQGWRSLLTGIEHWEIEGYKYECASWYRQRYDVPPLPFGKKVYLAFESMNETLWLWINGSLVDPNKVTLAANGKPLLVDVAGLLRSNQQNLIVVRRSSGLEPGGGWKSVKVLAEK